MMNVRGAATILTLTVLLVTAPVTAHAALPFPYDLRTGREATLAATGTSLLLTSLILAHDNTPLTPAELAALDRDGLPSLDRAATRHWMPGAAKASDRLVTVLTIAPLALATVGPGQERGGRVALMYAETMLLSGGATALLKHAVARPRPFTYNDDARIDPALRLSGMARRSFPSGHTAQSFAAMVFLATVHGKLQPRGEGWVWAGCLGAAATVGWLRYEAGYHFPTDILAGAAIGATAGWLVPHLHELDEGSTTAAPVEGVRIGVGFAF